MKKLLALFLCVGIIAETGILTVMITEKYTDTYKLQAADVQAKLTEAIGEAKYKNTDELTTALASIVIRGVQSLVATNDAANPTNANVNILLLDGFSIDANNITLVDVLASA